MIAFGIVLVILFLFSLFGFESDYAFSKQKTFFSKSLYGRRDYPWSPQLSGPVWMDTAFPFLGSAICIDVSLYFGVWDVAEFLIQSRSFLFINIEENLENRVTIFIHGAIVFCDSKTSK